MASESVDSGQNRLSKITELIEFCKYSIHDLSRCVSTTVGEHFRMNMPFELGIDYGCRQFKGEHFSGKKFLVLEEQRYRYQAAISDLSGCDIQTHSADNQIAAKKVRNWLVSEAGTPNIGARKILDEYEDFQEWYVEMHIHAGASFSDIREYPTSEFLAGMKQWMQAGRPSTFT